MRRAVYVATLTVLVVVVGFVYAYQLGYLSPRRLTIFHAGSLAVPLERLSEKFVEQCPGTRIARESSGSVDAVRKVVDLHRSCDLLAVADYRLIPELMYEGGYASWYLVFASNSLVIAYTEKSRYSDEITSQNWYQILAREDVVIGRSDPDRDPCGYRALMLFQLASIYYGNPAINETLAGHEKTVIKPKSVELLAGLEAGTIDYAIEYKSVAIQHGLKYVELPDELNLSNPEMAEYYSQAVVVIRHGEETLEIRGSPILYGITVPSTAQNVETAVKFLQFLLSEDGRRILEECGMQPVYPALTDNLDAVPEVLRQHATQK